MKKPMKPITPDELSALAANYAGMPDTSLIKRLVTLATEQAATIARLEATGPAQLALFAGVSQTVEGA